MTKKRASANVTIAPKVPLHMKKIQAGYSSQMRKCTMLKSKKCSLFTKYQITH